MKKTIIIAGAILALGFTAAQAHDSRGNSNTGLANVTANVGGLLGLNANVGSSRGGLLNVTANVGQQSHSSSLLNVDANVGGHNGVANAQVQVGSNCAYCSGHEGGVGHW